MPPIRLHAIRNGRIVPYAFNVLSERSESTVASTVVGIEDEIGSSDTRGSVERAEETVVSSPLPGTVERVDSIARREDLPVNSTDDRKARDSYRSARGGRRRGVEKQHLTNMPARVHSLWEIWVKERDRLRFEIELADRGWDYASERELFDLIRFRFETPYSLTREEVADSLRESNVHRQDLTPV